MGLTNSLVLLILRLGIDGYMISQLGQAADDSCRRFRQVGDPFGQGSGLSLVMVVMAEFFCAMLVMLGLATRFAAAPVVFVATTTHLLDVVLDARQNKTKHLYDELNRQIGSAQGYVEDDGNGNPFSLTRQTSKLNPAGNTIERSDGLGNKTLRRPR